MEKSELIDKNFIILYTYTWILNRGFSESSPRFYRSRSRQDFRHPEFWRIRLPSLCEMGGEEETKKEIFEELYG
jgi:hypothetical protein